MLRTTLSHATDWRPGPKCMNDSHSHTVLARLVLLDVEDVVSSWQWRGANISQARMAEAEGHNHMSLYGRETQCRSANICTGKE